MKKILFLIFFSIITSSVGANEIDELTKLADDGDPIAQNNLGHYYLYMSDDNPDDKELLDKAIYYLNAAAEQEQVNAMTTVGWTYFTGEHGAPKDNEQAIYWNQRASDLGFTIASYNMGFFYYSGLGGVKKDLVKAKQYWELSASQWITSTNRGGSMPEELLDEINEYNKNPTNEMIKLRDWYIGILNSIES